MTRMGHKLVTYIWPSNSAIIIYDEENVLYFTVSCLTRDECVQALTNCPQGNAHCVDGGCQCRHHWWVTCAIAYEPRLRKHVFGVSNQVRHKPDCTARGLKFRSSEEERLHYLCSENKSLISWAAQFRPSAQWQLICAFVSAYAESIDMTHII